MSHSNTREEGSGPDYLRGWRDLFLQLRKGKSFSGHERKCLFLNAHGQGFVNGSSVSGLDLSEDSRGVALVDWDQDGRLDAWTSNRTGPRVRLFRNELAGAGHHVAFRLEGTRSNRDGIGAAVSVRTARGAATRWSKAGSGFLSQSSKELFFGLGDAQAIESVVVRWPGGAEERFEGVELDRRHVLVEGTGAARVLPPRSPAVALGAAQPVPLDLAQAPGASELRRTLLAARLDLPRVPYRTGAGEERSLDESLGKPLLVSFWASWCAPCLDEFEEWTAHADQLVASGLDVLALNTDTIQYRMIAARRLSGLGWPFRSGYTQPQTLEVLDVLNLVALESHADIALPTSLLVDADHRLIALYRGPVSAEQVLRDLATPSDPRAVRDAAAPFPGRWLGAPPENGFEELARCLAERGLTDLLVRRPGPEQPAPASPPGAVQVDR